MTTENLPVDAQASGFRSTAPDEAARTEATALHDNHDAPAPNGAASLLANGSGDTPDIDPARLDPEATRVVQRLLQRGHQAYFVGGCVRDLLIGKEPKDFDVATSATPDEVRALFRNSRLIGRRFRLAHVYFKGGKVIEVSTFRASPTMVEEPQPSEALEGEVHTEGAEHIAQADQEALAAVEVDAEPPSTPVEDVQDEVTPPVPVQAAPEKDLLITEDNVFGTAEEDARRRDFTMNGLFYDVASGRVIDHVRGLRDLAEREIRTIGDPEKRMREDPVRILRAVRFAAKLGLDIEARTYAAMEGCVEDLPRCSQARLLEETFRLVRGGDAATALKLIAALDALKMLLSPVDEYLRGQDAEGVEEYWNFVATMDERIKSSVPFDDSQVLACILLPIALDEPADATEEEEGSKPPSVNEAIERLLQELVQKARLPRRIAERCRMMLQAQRALAGLRRKRGGLGRFRAHPLFREALSVFEVWVKATGEHEAALESWRAGGAPTPSPDAPGPKRRRRGRRRGPRGREGGGREGGGREGGGQGGGGQGGGDAGGPPQGGGSAGGGEPGVP
jgi:poly(A) polymerase